MTSRSGRRADNTARRRQTPRQGTAAVEFAVCLPLMLLITFGAIEAANGVYLKQILTQAAYEGARMATNSGGSETAARDFAQQILDARDVQSSVITFDPPVSALTLAGTEIAVTVTAPYNSNAFAPLWYFRDEELSARVVMVRN